MENASKALIIAGSIFLAIALITFAVYTYQSLHNMANAQDEKNAQEQLVAFNKKYEAYNKSIMYGTDVITVVNMADEDNQRYNMDIKIYVAGTAETKNSLKSKYSDVKSKIYKCEFVNYDNTTGRINEMKFVEKT